MPEGVLPIVPANPAVPNTGGGGSGASKDIGGRGEVKTNPSAPESSPLPGALGDAVDAANAYASAVDQLASILQDPEFWQRVLLILIGIILCWIGFWMIIASSTKASAIVGLATDVVPGGGIIKKATKVASKVAG